MDEELLTALVVMSAHTQDIPIGELVFSDNLLATVTEYDEALRAALVTFVQLRHPDWSSEEVSRIVTELEGEGQASYIVLATLNGETRQGIWDGIWDKWVSDPNEIELLQEHLNTLLGHYADSAGGGLLNEAIAEAARDNSVYALGGALSGRPGVIYEAN